MRELFSIPFEGCIGLKRFVFLLMILLTARVTFGGTAFCDLALRVLNAAPRIQAVAARMNAQIANPKDAMTSLRKTTAIMGFTRPVLLNPDVLKGRSESSGAYNGGVYQVTLIAGSRVVLKLVPAESYNDASRPGGFGGTRLVHPNFAEPVLIQQALAELDMAPRLFAVLPQRDAFAWLRREGLSLPPHSSGNHVALIMESLERPWSVTKSSEVPPELATFSKDQMGKMVARIKEIEITLEKLGVKAHDGQIFVMPDGKVMLGDLDLFERLKVGEQRESFNDHITFLVMAWEKARGETFPPAELQSLKTFEAVPR